jgi:pimeloyl-ACP methyl ester carboxylesterase
MITRRFIQTNGVRLSVLEAGEGPLVVLLHGWPQTASSWRHQLTAIAAAGFHVVAPDLRGTGKSDAPTSLEAYSMKTIVADVLGLIDACGAKDALIVGHDWGANTAWTCAALHPERVRAVAGLSVPYLGRAPAPPTKLFEQAFAGKWFYVSYFQAPGVAEAELEADVERTLRVTFAGTPGFDVTSPLVQARKPGDGFLTGAPTPALLPPWLTESELREQVKDFEQSGFRGGLNRYRNLDRDWRELELGRIEVPALFLVGERDPGRAFAPVEPMQALVPKLEPIVVIPNAGHWLQEEAPDPVTGALLRFLSLH